MHLLLSLLLSMFACLSLSGTAQAIESTVPTAALGVEVAYADASTTEPSTLLDILQQARQAQDAGNWSNAVSAFTRVLEEYPDHPYAVLQAQHGLLTSYTSYAPQLLSPVSLANAGFETDSDENGVADGWDTYLSLGDMKSYLCESNKIINSSFEDIDYDTGKPYDWQIIGDGLKLSPLSEPNQVGQRSIVLSSSGALHQTITGLTIGKIYRLRYFSTNPTTSVGVDPQAGVDPASSSILRDANPTGLTLEENSWQQFEISWKASSTSATVFITSGEGMVDRVSVGVDESSNGYRPIPDPAAENDPAFLDGKQVQVIDFSNVFGTAGGPAENRVCILSQRVSGCEIGKGYLLRVPMLLRTPVTGPWNFWMQVGIDPFGGSDSDSPSVVWSEACDNRSFERVTSLLVNRANKDWWRPFFVSAKAESSEITLFVKIVARPRGWRGICESIVLVDDVELYATDDTTVVEGYASGSSGEDIPEIYGRFAVMAAYDKAISRNSETSDKHQWAKMWQARAMLDLGETDAVKSQLDSIENASSDMAPWLAFNKACSAYFLADKRSGLLTTGMLGEVEYDYPDHVYIRTWSRVLCADMLLKCNHFKEADEVASRATSDADAGLFAKGLASYIIGEACQYRGKPQIFNSRIAEKFANAASLLDGAGSMRMEALFLSHDAQRRLGNKAGSKALLEQIRSMEPKNIWESNIKCMTVARFADALCEDGNLTGAEAVLSDALTDIKLKKSPSRSILKIKMKEIRERAEANSVDPLAEVTQ